MIRSVKPILAASMFCILALAAIGGCEGGTSSETVGMVEETAGQDVISGRTDPGNTLGLYSADFLPHLDQGFAMTVTADSSGTFVFPISAFDPTLGPLEIVIVPDSDVAGDEAVKKLSVDDLKKLR